MTRHLIPHCRPLRDGRLVNRFNRFIADVELDGNGIVSAHCVNPGSMEGLVRPGARVWVSPAPPGRRRKLQWTLELIELAEGIVGANTVVPNRIAETLIRDRAVPGLKRWRRLEREVPYGDGARVDLMLRGATDHLVEVKNCHLVYPDGRAYFPDSVSVRAANHLRELASQVASGRKATVLFVLQRTDGRSLRPSRLHDPAFGDAAVEARDAGVRFRALRVQPTPDGYVFDRMIPVDLDDYDPGSVAPYREALSPYSGWRRR